MTKKITIIGAGEIGRAIAFVLRDARDITIALWDNDPSKASGQGSLADTAASAHMLFLCVPSWAVRDALGSLWPHLAEQTLVLSLSKGIEGATHKTMAELLPELLPQHHTAILHGPMLAEELLAGLPGVGVVASTDTRLFSDVADVFRGTQVALEFSQDMRGVAFAGVLKNVYALGLGMVTALQIGSNFMGWYIERATAEMTHILLAMGGSQNTAYGAAGLGDLIATGLSPYSRNHEIGRQFATKGSTALTSEGLASLPPLLARLDGMMSDLPLASAIGDVTFKARPAREVLAGMIYRTR